MRHHAGVDEPKDRLKAARSRAGFESAAAAARALGIPPARYNHHENGIRGFDFEVAARYAERFGTTAEWLLSGKERTVAPSGQKQAREVIKLSWVAAGRLGPVSPIESVAADGRTRIEDLPAGDWVALEVRGRSMERIAPEGSTIVVNRRDKALIAGRYYVIVAQDGEATFKRYRASPDRFTPYSLDADEEPIYPDQERDRDWQVFGRVARVIQDV